MHSLCSQDCRSAQNACPGNVWMTLDHILLPLSRKALRAATYKPAQRIVPSRLLRTNKGHQSKSEAVLCFSKKVRLVACQ